MQAETTRSLVLLLLAVPLAAGIVAALLGPRRLALCAGSALRPRCCTLVVAIAVAMSFAELRGASAGRLAKRGDNSATFHPQFVTQTEVLHVGSRRRRTPFSFTSASTASTSGWSC